MAAEYMSIRTDLLRRGQPLFVEPEKRPLCGWCGDPFDKLDRGMKVYCSMDCRKDAERARKRV